MDKRQLKKYITFYALERLYRDMYTPVGDPNLEGVYDVSFRKENKYKSRSDQRENIDLKQEGVNLLFEIYDIDPRSNFKGRRFDRPALSRSQVIRFTDVLESMIKDAEKKIR